MADSTFYQTNYYNCESAMDTPPHLVYCRIYMAPSKQHSQMLIV